MAVAGFGLPELLILVILGGSAPGELASLVPTQDYFKSRGIEITHDKLMELASSNPTDSKTHFRQIMALKALGEDAANFKASPKFADYRKKLEPIAQGREAQDPAGFAKEHAARLLNGIDGKTLEEPPHTPRAFEQTLKSFPVETGILAFLNHRLGGTERIPAHLLDFMQKEIPEDQRGRAYDMIEKFGNLKLERFAIGFHETKEKAKETRFQGGKAVEVEVPVVEIYIRITGQGNRLWLAEVFAKENRGNVENAKGPNGEEMTFVKSQRPPAMAFIGSTDILIAGYKAANQAGHDKVLQKMLDVHFGKADSVFKGPLAAELKKIPDKAAGLAVGETLAHMAQGLPIPFPKTIFGHVTRTAQGQDFVVDLRMEKAEQAGDLVKLVIQGKTLAIDGLKKIQDMAPPMVNVAAILGILESVQIQASDRNVSMRLLVTDEGVMALPSLILIGRN